MRDRPPTFRGTARSQDGDWGGFRLGWLPPHNAPKNALGGPLIRRFARMTDASVVTWLHFVTAALRAKAPALNTSKVLRLLQGSRSPVAHVNEPVEQDQQIARLIPR